MSKTIRLMQIKKLALPILKQNSVVEAGIFGSIVQGTAKKIVILIF